MSIISMSILQILLFVLDFLSTHAMEPTLEENECHTNIEELCNATLGEKKEFMQQCGGWFAPGLADPKCSNVEQHPHSKVTLYKTRVYISRRVILHFGSVFQSMGELVNIGSLDVGSNATAIMLYDTVYPGNIALRKYGALDLKAPIRTKGATSGITVGMSGLFRIEADSNHEIDIRGIKIGTRARIALTVDRKGASERVRRIQNLSVKSGVWCLAMTESEHDLEKECVIQKIGDDCICEHREENCCGKVPRPCRSQHEPESKSIGCYTKVMSMKTCSRMTVKQHDTAQVCTYMSIIHVAVEFLLAEFSILSLYSAAAQYSVLDLGANSTLRIKAPLVGNAPHVEIMSQVVRLKKLSTLEILGHADVVVKNELIVEEKASVVFKGPEDPFSFFGIKGQANIERMTIQKNSHLTINLQNAKKICLEPHATVVPDTHCKIVVDKDICEENVARTVIENGENGFCKIIREKKKPTSKPDKSSETDNKKKTGNKEKVPSFKDLLDEIEREREELIKEQKQRQRDKKRLEAQSQQKRDSGKNDSSVLVVAVVVPIVIVVAVAVVIVWMVYQRRQNTYVSTKPPVMNRVNDQPQPVVMHQQVPQGYVWQ